MEAVEARQKAHEWLEEVRRYKRWHYRRSAIIALIPLVEQEGMKAEVEEGSISFERQVAHGERYRLTFRNDGTIKCEIYDGKGVLAMVTGSVEDFFVDMLAGSVPVKG